MKTLTKIIYAAFAVVAALAPISATAASGELYVAVLDTSIITFTPTGTQSTFVSDLIRPRGVAFDTTGNLFVSNLGDQSPTGGSILKIARDRTQSPFATGLDTPSPIAFDSAGNLYAASASGGGTVYKINPAGGVSVFATFVGDQLFGLAFDRAGNLFVAF